MSFRLVGEQGGVDSPKLCGAGDLLAAAIEAARSGVRVELRPDGRVIIDGRSPQACRSTEATPMGDHQTSSELPSMPELVERYATWAVHRKGRRLSYITRSKRVLVAMINETRAIQVPDVRAVDDWIITKRQQGVWSQKTANIAVTAFRSFGEWMAGQGYAWDNPFARLEPAVDDGERNASKTAAAFTTEEFHRMIAVARRQCECDGRCQTPRWLQYACQGYLGLRASEVAYAGRRGNPDGGIKWRDIDWERRILKVRAKVAKIRNKSDLPIHPSLMAMMVERRDWLIRAGKYDLDDYVCGTVVRDRTFDMDLARAGIPKHNASGNTYSSTSFRKWFASSLTAAGVDPIRRAELMRHSSTRTTERHYVDHDRVDLADAVLRSLPHTDGGAQVFVGFLQAASVDSRQPAAGTRYDAPAMHPTPTSPELKPHADGADPRDGARFSAMSGAGLEQHPNTPEPLASHGVGEGGGEVSDPRAVLMSAMQTLAAAMVALERSLERDCGVDRPGESPAGANGSAAG